MTARNEEVKKHPPPFISHVSRSKALFTQEHRYIDATLLEWLEKTSWIEALADPGYSHHQSFLQELFFRLNEIFLPDRSPERDIYAHLRAIGSSISLQSSGNREILHTCLSANLEGCLQTNNSGSRAFTPALRARLHRGVVRAYELISTHFISAALILGDVAGENVRNADPGKSSQVDWDAIETALERTLSRLRETGIYLDQVFLVEIQRKRLRRMRFLHALLSEHITVKDRARVLATLLLDLVDQSQERRRIYKFLKKNLRLATQRIVAANSLHGEHYLIRNWDEYKMILRGAAGGGLCTAFTVLIKQLLGYLPLTDFSKGLAESINYSLSFLTIALFGFFLATKQPSATAPYLASAIKTNDSEWRHSLFSLLRAQTVSVMGNVLAVIPICLIAGEIAVLLGHPLMKPNTALQTLDMADPLGFVPLFAAFTGILLFFSSLLGGWFENWTQIHSLPERIRENPKLRKLVGTRIANSIARIFAHHANVLGSSIALGFLLGMTPQVLRFFNIPLEARHVTLTSGMLSLALPHLPNGTVHWQTLLNLFSGVCLIAALNISVSFALTLSLASLSVELKPFSTLKRVGRGVLDILRRPWNLFVP